MTEQQEFFGFSSEDEIKRRRAEMLLTLSPSKTKTLDVVAHNLNEDIEDYECTEYERDLFYYDGVGEEVLPVGNDSWRAVLTDDVRMNRVHYISSKKMCKKASCRKGGRHKCKCPLIPEVTYSEIRDIVWDIVEVSLGRTMPEKDGEEMLEELAAAEIAEDKEMDIDNEIIELFKPDTDHAIVTSAMAALENDEPIWKPEGRWPADMMAEHDVNVALKEDHHVQRDVTHECVVCNKWKYIASNIGEIYTCEECIATAPTITGPADDMDPFAFMEGSKDGEAVEDDEDATDDEDVPADDEFADHVLKLMIPGRLGGIYLTKSDINKPGNMWPKSQIHHAVTGRLPFTCEKAKFNLDRAGDKLLFKKSHAENIVKSRLEVIKERTPEKRNPVIAMWSKKSAPASKKAPKSAPASKKAKKSAPVEEPAPKKKKKKVTTKKKKKKVTNNVDLLTNAIVGGGTQVYRYELGEGTIKPNGKRGRTIYCCPEKNCKHHDHNFQRVDSLIRHLHEKHNYDVLDDEGNIIPRYWHVCVHPNCMKKCAGNGIKGYHNTNQYIAHMLKRHQRRIVKTLNAEGKHKKSKKGYSMWHVDGFPRCTVERYRRDCAPGCQCWGAQ